MPAPSPRYDLLFGVMALQTQFITEQQFLDAAIRSAAGETALADELVASGAITPEGRKAIEQLANARMLHFQRQGTGQVDKTAGAPQHSGAPSLKSGWIDQLPSDQLEDFASGTLHAIGIQDDSLLVPSRGDGPGGPPGTQLDSFVDTVRSLVPRHVPVKPVVLSRQKLDRYEKRHEVARGGLGRILLVRDNDAHREIAWKELLDTAKAGAGEVAFLQEARITAQLEHPNIVPVYELGVGQSGKPYYTMRFIRGRPMTELIREQSRERRARQSPDPVADALARMRLLQAFLGACQAVAYAHSKGVIHRDIKPANIMLGDFGEVLVVDWGLALVRARRAEDDTGDFVDTLSGVSTDTMQDAVAGTPAYMSPEQAEGVGDRIDHRSDIYALGAVLYEILTHQIPFRGPNALAVLMDVRQGKLVPPSQRAPHLVIPRTLEEICLRAMAHDPEQRYQSVEELSQDVTLFVEGTQEREKMHARSAERMAEAREMTDRYWQLRDDEDAAMASLEKLKDEVVGHEPPAKKQTLFDAEARYERLRNETTDAWNALIRAYNECLAFEPDNAAARSDMAALYWRMFAESEKAGPTRDMREQAFYRSQVEYFDDEKRFADALVGDGHLHIAVDRTNATVRLGRNREVGRVLTTVEWQELGAAPATVRPLAMGSWHAQIDREGCRRVELPVRIGRQQGVECSVRMFDAQYLAQPFEVPADSPVPRPGAGQRWVQVPAGEFIYGDRQAPGGEKPEVVFEPDFFIARAPVTAGDYLEFLNDLHTHGEADQAKARQPRQAADSGYYWIFDEAADAYRLPRGEEVERYAWEPRWPVMCVNWHDAVAYCAWLGKRIGARVTLPTAPQWEKAARGVDGRSFPWGDREDSTWLNCGQARATGAQIMPVGSYPVDCSPFGVLDMAGNVGDWCLDEVGEKYPGWKNIRGGYWTQTVSNCRPGARRGYTADALFYYIGFRPVILPGAASD
ncbi:MAG: SUMF1/EgtB/PvdO family nonheme iron enzyme [Planctomycetota bacterium]